MDENRSVEVNALDLEILMTAALRYVSLSQGYAPPATDRWASEIKQRVDRYGPQVGMTSVEEPMAQA